MHSGNDVAFEPLQTADLAVDVEYDPEADAYRTDFDPAERSTSEAVVEAVAAATRTDVLSLPPLHSVVDADALDGLFAAIPGERLRFGRTAFEYAGCAISVSGSGDLLVEVDGTVEDV
ncbi:hypothetical protein G9C85_13080 [Halorubellus sp. JP-L1]|uniref:HalOD1 output domain-containing protein n=1 Tax=Halorubellus sp. JP-L1 TaxID=2715753 RepID=UPI00140913A3|nr:HalOD1 output domain-containing protein [Halorubellus sp. JP-L1]NHN42553.1 hypothetical protein [Halorubellus sp. JP-L1]